MNLSNKLLLSSINLASLLYYTLNLKYEFFIYYHHGLLRKLWHKHSWPSVNQCFSKSKEFFESSLLSKYTILIFTFHCIFNMATCINWILYCKLLNSWIFWLNHYFFFFCYFIFVHIFCHLFFGVISFIS